VDHQPSCNVGHAQVRLPCAGARTHHHSLQPLPSMGKDCAIAQAGRGDCPLAPSPLIGKALFSLLWKYLFPVINYSVGV
jgi:hypothetical protein